MRTVPVRVLLLGDSISIGYTSVVRDTLGSRAVVVRPVTESGSPENCAGTNRGVVRINDWLNIDGGRFDVIHFNFGLHDLKRVHAGNGANSNDPSSPRQAELPVYLDQLREITDEILGSGAIAIFATTTPVPSGGVRPHRAPGDVVAYNEGSTALMGELGVSVNDLYSFVLPSLETHQRPGNVHFTPAGSKALGLEVSRAILAEVGPFDGVGP